MTSREKGIVMEKENKKVFSRIGISLFIITIVVNLVQSIISVIIHKVAPEFEESSWYLYSMIIVSFYLVGAPLFYLLVKKLPVAEKKEKKPLKIYQILCLLVMCLGSMYVFNMIGVMINYICGMLIGKTDLNPLNTAIGGLDILPTALIVGIASPIVEELVFRKVLLDRLRNYGDVIAILVSGLCFGFYHGNVAQFLYASVLGFLFAYVVIRTEDIRYSILLHICINMVGSVILPQVVNMGMIATMCVGFAVMAIIGLTIVFFILAIVMKKLRFEKGNISLEKPFKTVGLNAGMILYVVISLVFFVVVLFSA
ncbi:MAG: CPBP family intramembrane metalloprotease [Lachnospiraceae bacterium]|nr:CPBP family intramembrane metalloprotease [Lachnospiraceae bacterium]